MGDVVDLADYREKRIARRAWFMLPFAIVALLFLFVLFARVR